VSCQSYAKGAAKSLPLTGDKLAGTCIYPEKAVDEPCLIGMSHISVLDFSPNPCEQNQEQTLRRRMQARGLPLLWAA
jgi:hypothetical protein